MRFDRIQGETMKGGYLLLTGASGLLGQYLMRDLLQRGYRVAVLLRGRRTQSAAERTEQILQYWERQFDKLLPRPVCLAGDITQSELGLTPSDRLWVRDHVDRMFHCAASLTFQEHKGEPWRTNVDGTRHVVEFCQAHGIHDMHYVSTAYVCGRREDRVYEDELDVGQEFRNDYEKSKFLAEQIVRQCPAFDQLTIYRPVVITGDSTTGYTSTYHGTYLYMKLASVLASNIEPNEQGDHHIPIRWGATGKERRNITPVDWNSEVICRLLANSQAHGRTFHLAPAEPLTMRDVIEYAARYFRLSGIEFHGYGDQPDFRLNELERWIWSNVKIYGAYDFMDAQFDMTNLLQFVPDFPSPRIDYAFAQRLMRFAEEDRWGKRKPPAPKEAPIDVEATLQALHETSSPNGPPAMMGLDVTGPGGGGYHLSIQNNALVGLGRGLPPSGNPVLRIPSDELAEWHVAARSPGEFLGRLLAACKEAHPMPRAERSVAPPVNS